MHTPRKNPARLCPLARAATMPAWFITRSGVIVPQQSTHARPELSRALGPITAGAILAGSVIGTGIFLVPATMAREAGSIEGVFAVWIFGALLTLCGAFTYAELGSSLPEAGGE